MSKLKSKSKRSAPKSEARPGKESRDHKKAAFLRAFRKLRGKQYLAAEAIGVHHNTVWEWRKKDKAFAADYDSALELTTDEIELEMENRAMEKSDLLGIFLLKGRRPEKYRDNASVELGGKGGGPIELTVLDYSKAKGREGTAG